MKSKNDVIVSVIVPVYKVELYLKMCIDSLIKQDFENYEIILIDDGSPDNCPKMCDEFAATNKNIKVVHQKNQGLSAARNSGLKVAKGKYVCFVDSDDYVERNYLKELVFVAKNKDLDVVICNYNRVYENSIQKCYVDKFNCENFITPAAWNKLYKKSLFENIKFPVGMHYEDLSVFPKIMMQNVNIGFTDKHLYNYIQNPQSIMHITNDRIFEIFEILADNMKYAKLNGKYEKYQKNLEMAYVFHVLIGTTYRASFHEKFSIKMINRIKNEVVKNYPKWYNNIGIKKLNIIYRIFLIAFKFNLIFLIYLMLKLFNKAFKKYI